MTVREMLATGRFNHMSQIKQTDGSILVTLTRRGDSSIYNMVVTGLYTESEKILLEEIIDGNSKIKDAPKTGPVASADSPG